MDAIVCTNQILLERLENITNEFNILYNEYNVLLERFEDLAARIEADGNQSISYSNLTVSQQSVRLGENVTISLTIQNHINSERSIPYSINLYWLGGGVDILCSTRLNPYEVKEVKQIFVPESVGNYTVNLLGMGLTEEFLVVDS